MLLDFINYIKGTVKISVKGSYLERFFNLCASNDIYIWDVEHKDIDMVHLKVSAKHFRKLHKISKNSRCRIHIINKKGICFFTFKFRKRYVMWAGLVVFLLGIYITTSRIWSVTILGESQVDKREIMRRLDENHVRIGVSPKAIDVKLIKNNMLTSIDKLSFISLNINGNELRVEIKDKKPMPEIEEEIGPSNIISDKTGVLYKMDVKQGRAVKKVGETVMNGERIVDSLMLPRVEEREKRLVHSDAEILIRTWYTRQHVMSKNINQKVYTGKIKTKYSIIVAKDAINLYTNYRVPFENYDKSSEMYEIYLNESFVLPIKLEKQIYTEYEVSEYQLSKAQVVGLLKTGSQACLQKTIDGEISKINHTFKQDKDIVMVYTSAECIESVGKQEVDTRTQEEVNYEKFEKEQ